MPLCAAAQRTRARASRTASKVPHCLSCVRVRVRVRVRGRGRGRGRGRVRVRVRGTPPNGDAHTLSCTRCGVGTEEEELHEENIFRFKPGENRDLGLQQQHRCCIHRGGTRAVYVQQDYVLCRRLAVCKPVLLVFSHS